MLAVAGRAALLAPATAMRVHIVCIASWTTLAQTTIVTTALV
jgi:hypothetical protein